MVKHKLIKKKNLNKKPFLNREKDIAIDFASKVHKKFSTLIKASILFGSQAKNEAVENSDIDVIFIIDDASINWDLELISWYREELAKITSQQKYGRELHVNTMKLTTWWEDLLHGDPVVINIVRYGEALIDSGGFFNPIKSLLIQGRIKSTPEAVYNALQRAPMHIRRSKISEMSAIEGVYWAIIDSAQAALITAGKMPPSPEHIPEMLKETFVDTGMLHHDSVKAVKEIFSIHKSIAHGLISDIRGKDIDAWQERAEKFLADMVKLVDKLLESKK
jgi:predicted nucleotidyltransferase/uncharacterized protein (UPF0332 family)